MNTKKNINPWACLSLGLLLVGCSQPFEVTSKMDTTNSETTNCTIHIEQVSFAGTNDQSKKEVAPLNANLINRTDSLTKAIENEANSFFTEYDEQLKAGKIEFPRPAFKYELYCVDSLFAVSDKIISTMTIAYEYCGGAHGNTDFYATNYSPKNQQFLSNQELLDYKQAAQIDSLLKVHFNNVDSAFWSEPTLEQVAAINVTANSMRFQFGYYALGPYSSGAPVVEVPLDELKGVYLLNRKD